GVRGFVDSTAASSGLLLSDRLKLINEESLRKSLVAAGMYRTSARTLIGYQLIGAIALPAIWIWIAFAANTKPAVAIIAAIFFALIGWIAPGFVVRRRAERRIHQIDRGMPELVDLLVLTI